MAPFTIADLLFSPLEIIGGPSPQPVISTGLTRGPPVSGTAVKLKVGCVKTRVVKREKNDSSRILIVSDILVLI
jgi:hypothetical protein